MAMGRGGGRRPVLLICAVATLLLVSSSAVSGFLDENVREFGRFVGRFGREHPDREVRVTERPEAFGADAAVEERKSVEIGFLEKTRSFLSGIATSVVGNDVPNPSSLLPERKNWAGLAKVSKEEKAKKGFGRKGHVFGRHNGFGHSRWAGIRDLVWNHPDKLAAAASADISATEPVVIEDDSNLDNPGSRLLVKVTVIVMKVVEEYKAQTVEPNLESTCADALEDQVKIFVARVKSALQERLCSGVVPIGEQTFCNLVKEHPTMATFQGLWMTHVNPVKVSWRRISKTAACSSANPVTSFLDSLLEMEELARQFTMLLPEVIDMEEKNIEHPMFQPHMDEWVPYKPWVPSEHELRMVNMKFHHLGEVHEHGDLEKHEDNERPMAHWMRRHHLEEHQDHAKHWWQRLSGIFYKHKHMRHFGFEHAHDISPRDVCFYKSVKYLNRGIRQHLATTCQSTTSPNVIAACTFAKEHHFLVKAWLAMEIPVWIKAAKGCTHNFEDRHAPDLGIGHVGIVERKVSDPFASIEAGETVERQLNTFPHGISSDCAKRHGNRGFSKALHLRGHVMGINHGENGLRGPVRTHLIVLEGHPLHLHDFRHALENVQTVDDNLSGEMLSDLEDRFVEFVSDIRLVKDAISDEHRALPEMMLFKPFHHRPNFRISANPRVLEISDGPHFRISARPRVVDKANNEISVIGPNDVVEDVAGDMDAEVKLEFKTSYETAEKRADM